jgi:hypothetical protein
MMRLPLRVADVHRKYRVPRLHLSVQANDLPISLFVSPLSFLIVFEHIDDPSYTIGKSIVER